MSDDQQRFYDPSRMYGAEERTLAPTDRTLGAEHTDEDPEVEGHRLFGTTERYFDAERFYKKG